VCRHLTARPALAQRLHRRDLTCGGLDADQLFYLQTRGLPIAQAEALLLEGFAGELVDGIGHKGLVAPMRDAISAWLAARHKPAAQALDWHESSAFSASGAKDEQAYLAGFAA
jgi:hypothetical protein